MRQTSTASVRQEQRALSSVAASAAINSGLVGAGAHIPPLPGTRMEAEQIMSLVPEEGRMCLFDFEVNRAAVADPGLAEYRYVHFATHGFLDSQHPELSGILLSMYDRRRAARWISTRARSIQPEALSRTRDAERVPDGARQGDSRRRADELDARLHDQAYRAVVVSLWNVSDEATAELMARFYHEILKNGKRPAAALQAAQISMLNEQDFASPYYWAAFTLQGEWR